MKDIVIKVENISKQYRLGLVNSGTMRDDLLRWWYQVRGKENPLLKVGEVNDRTTLGSSNYVWSLQDIDFEVEKGEILGIVGANGAGKSTLLKLLSKVTAPTTGTIKSKGRIASLLEVGTGFHPELTGRENIYLNGAILGMRRSEITRKMDEIIAFSGVERYINTPVKRYSSGMYVRLAFAVAAHLESEILIIDEVLAVGDVEFQKKCLGKIGEINQGEGRTVLFVSHNMSAVKELCSKVLLLKNGKVESIGQTNSMIRKYLANPITISSANDLLDDHQSRRGDGSVRFLKIEINKGQIIQNPLEDVILSAEVQVFSDIENLNFFMGIKGPDTVDTITNTGFVRVSEDRISEGTKIEFAIKIPRQTFRTGLFPLYLWLGSHSSGNVMYDLIDSVYNLNFESEASSDVLGYDFASPGGYFNMQYELLDFELHK